MSEQFENISIPFWLLEQCQLLCSNSSTLTKLDLTGHYGIGDNLAVTLALFLRGNHTLEELILSNCGIEPKGAKALFEMLGRNKGLKKLVVDSNYCSSESLVVLSNSLMTNHTLVELDLEDNDFSDFAMEFLVRGLYDNSSVRIINLGGNDIGAVGAAQLGRLLAVHRHLHEILLHDNSLGDEGTTHIVEGIAENEPSSVEIMSLANNQIGVAGATDLGKLLASANSNMKELYLYDNLIGNPGATQLAQGVEHNPGVCPVKLLHLESTGIGNQGAKAIGIMLKSRRQIISMLQLKDNRIADEGAVAIAGGVEIVGNCLESLDLSENEVGNAGAAAFRAALSRENPRLKELHLDDNNIDNDGVVELAQGMGRNASTFRSLHVEDNNLEAPAAKALGLALTSTSQNLRELFLAGNDIGPVGAGLLVEGIESGGIYCRLEILQVIGNAIQDEGAAAFGKLLRASIAPELKELYMRANDITAEGLAAFLGSEHSDEGSPKLVDLCQNPIRDNEVNKLVNVFRHNLKLRKLNLDFCFENEESKAHLVREGLQHNYYLEEFSLDAIENKALEEEIKFYLRLNAAGRRVLRYNPSVSVWPFLLAKVGHNPSMVFYFLREKPSLCNYRAQG